MSFAWMLLVWVLWLLWIVMACNFPHCILTGQFLYFPWEARVMGRRLTAAFAECYRQSSCELLFTAASRQFLLFGCQLPSLLDAGMNVDYLRSAARILVLINFLESWASASFAVAPLSSWPPEEGCLSQVPWCPASATFSTCPLLPRKGLE